MAFGAMTGQAHASIVPPGGFSRELSWADSFNHGFCHSFGTKIGEQKAEISSLRAQVEQLQREHAEKIPDLKRYKKRHPKGIDDSLLRLDREGKFESRQEFAQRLKRAGLIELQPGNAAEGQHVSHIIAASNGGPDHTDNYLYALGGTFNMAIGDKFDALNCFLAGKAKARKAVAIATEVAKDKRLHHHIEQRGRDRRTFFEGCHSGLTGDDLYKQGQDLFRDMRTASRGR